MIRFSANLGFLWKDLALPDAIHRAAAAGFDAVECHEPYAHDPSDVLAARSDIESHTLALGRLRKVRFRGQEAGAITKWIASLRGH